MGFPTVVNLTPSGSFEETGNLVAQGANHIDPALLDILQTAAVKSGMQVQAYSGYRPGDPRFHGQGLATDIRIIGPDGKPLPNYQSPETFQAYETLAQAARQVQMEKYPDLDKQFRWGGYFSGDKGKYGAMDLMHFDLGGSDKLGMAGGSWENGLSKEQAANFPGAKSKGMGLLGIFDPDVQARANSGAADAANAMANGTLPEARTVQTVGYVPPPFSSEQGQFTPLLGGGEQQKPNAVQQPVAAPATPEAPSELVQPNDVMKAWGLDGPTAAPTQADQQTPAPQADPNNAIIKAWGLDKTDAAPANSVVDRGVSSPDTQTVGGRVGQSIDKAVDAVKPAVDTVGNIWSFDNNLVRQTATGVPIIGGALNRMNAATNAAIAPLVNPLLSDQNQLKGDTWSERYKNSLTEQNAMDANFQAAHPVIATGAQLAGGIASMGGLASKIPAVGNALGVTGNSLLGRTGAGIVSGGILGGGDAAVRSDGNPDEIGKGAALGAFAGGAAPAAGKLLGAVGNKLAGSNIPPRVAELAQLASDKYGINIGPGQLSTNPTIRFLDSVVNRLPLSGGTAAKEGQQQAFNKAVASTIGENASEITPEVLSAARSRIGKVFDSVADRTPAISGDNEFVSNLNGVMNNARQTIADSELGPLEKQFSNILGKFTEGNNTISGETYQALTRKGAPLDRAMASNDPNIRYYAGQMRDELDGALQRSATPEVLGDLSTARSQWRAMKTIEDLAEKAPTGDISPALLLGQVRKSYGNMAYGQGSDLVDLARVGQQFLKESPSSGTAERSQIMNWLLGGAGGGGVVSMVANPATIPYAAGSAVGGALLARGVGSVLRSPTLGNKMIQGALNAGQDIAPTTSNLLLRSTGQALPAQYNRLNAPRN